MTKYLFNSNIHGYEISDVNNFEKETTKDDIIILILSESCNEESSKYYKLVDDVMRRFTRVILIGIGGSELVFDAVASNMVVFGQYDIYKVGDVTDISAEYLIKIIDRHPDLAEAQTYLPSSVCSYSDLCTLLYGIDALVNEGNLEGLKAHIERHLTGIEGAVELINKLKATQEAFNSNELIDNINSLKAEIQAKIDELKAKDDEIESVKHSRDEKIVEADNLKRELAKIKVAVTDQSESDLNTGNVFTTYSAYNTAMHANNKALIIYFKEISYVRYMNTLISILCERIEREKKTFKLLIYDNNVNTVTRYGLDTITCQSYTSDKNNIIKNKKKVVVVEPFNAIIQDLVSTKDAVDVLIVYDRLGQYEDLVKGNNVTKFTIANSKADLDMVYKVKAITPNDPSTVITDVRNSYELGNGGHAQFLDIPFIDENFFKLTDSARFQKYNKLKSARSQEFIIQHIMHKAHIGE